MRFLGVLAIGASLAFTQLKAKEEPSDLARWEVAYSGDLVLAHKIYLTSPGETVSDELANMFYLFYACVKADEFEKAIEILQAIDVTVVGKIINPEEDYKNAICHEAHEG